MCHLPLSGSRGQRLSVCLQHPPLLRYRLLAIRVDRPLHPSNTHAMKNRLEPLCLKTTARCTSRGILSSFGKLLCFAEAPSQAYSMALYLSTSRRCFLCFIKMSEDPPSCESVSCRCSFSGSAGSGRARLEESRDEQLDHAAGIVARVEVSANAEAADATHQFVGINIGADLASLGAGFEQLSAHGHEAVKKVGMQRVEAVAVGLQDCGESMLGDQEINEEGDPLTECSVRRPPLRQQDRTSLGAGLDLMAVQGHHEIRSRREVAVHRPHPDAGRRRDVTHRRLDTGRDEHSGGGGEQRLLVALRVGPLLPT